MVREREGELESIKCVSMKGHKSALKDKCKNVLQRNGNKNRNGAGFPPLMYAYWQTRGWQHVSPESHFLHGHPDCLLRKLFASPGSSMTWV